ncbi:MAG: STAS domain-containing protein [Alphaproteobacteria bacterium]
MMTVTDLGNNQFDIKLDKLFDFESHKDFKTHIHEVMEKKPARITLNFDNVEYLDSSALGMLMLAKHEAETRNCQIAITNLHEGHPKKVLELMKFHQLFTIQMAA